MISSSSESHSLPSLQSIEPVWNFSHPWCLITKNQECPSNLCDVHNHSHIFTHNHLPPPPTGSIIPTENQWAAVTSPQGIGSHAHRGWEVLQCSICKFQNQENGPEDQGSQGLSRSLSPKAWRLGMLESQDNRRWVSQLKQRSKYFPSLPFCSVWALSRLDAAWGPCW